MHWKWTCAVWTMLSSCAGRARASCMKTCHRLISCYCAYHFVLNSQTEDLERRWTVHVPPIRRSKKTPNANQS